MTPSRGLRAALVAASLTLVVGCSSTDEPPAASDEPTVDRTWVSAPTLPPATEEDEDGTDEPTGGLSSNAEAGDGEPSTPRRAPHSVAAHFQNGLFGGDPEICDLLAAGARKDLVRTKVAEGAVPKGSSCEKYVRTIAKTYADWDVTVEAKVIEETATEAVVRVDMTLNNDVASTRMELVPAGDTWEITDWGQH